jgi:hypothetical protein
VTSPLGDEKWEIGSIQTITWTSAGFTGPVNILLSRNGGSSWFTISSSTANDGSQTWTVTGPSTSSARIKIVSVSKSTVFGISQVNHSIVPRIKVNVPNGGENWMIGSGNTITWQSTGLTGNVNIELSRDGGATWTALYSSTPNDGRQAWKVAGPETNQARIRIVSSSSPDFFDASDADFTIATPTINVISPNGGESWKEGSRQNISWTSNGLTGFVSVQISRDGGLTWTTLVSPTENDGIFTWLVSGPATTTARIRVISISDPGVFDVSNTNFSINGS